MTSIFTKLKQVLVNSSNKIPSGIDQIFYKKKLDEQTLNELEELLISADKSASVAMELVGKLRAIKFDKEVSGLVIKEQLADIFGNYW